MNRRAIVLGLAVVAAGAVAIALWPTGRSDPGEEGGRPDTAAHRALPPSSEIEHRAGGEASNAGETDPAAAQAHTHAAAEREGDLLPAEDPTGDLVFYERKPMSAIPHRVVRGWGARGAGRVPGFVGAVVVVDPSISDERLVRLARDIRAYHSDAEALSVRILDSERAGLYDRHSDGGALLARHLVGVVNRNARLGTDRITVRGREVTP
jgi:hypothetical protein